MRAPSIANVARGSWSSTFQQRQLFNTGSMQHSGGFKRSDRRSCSRTRMRLSQCTAPDSGKRAVAVDPEAKAANLRRLRRLEGQVQGLQKMVEEDRYCPEIMIQISAAQEAVRTVGRELMRNHRRHCVTHIVAEAAAIGLMPCTTNWSGCDL